jgi:hypothetical protein
MTVVLAIIAAGLLAFQLLRPNAHVAVEGGAPATPKAKDLAVRGDLSTEDRPSIPEKSIAVLPFDSLSEDRSNAYFAEGIQDEVITRLAKVADLKVFRAHRRNDSKAHHRICATSRVSSAWRTFLKAACRRRMTRCASTFSLSTP